MFLATLDAPPGEVDRLHCKKYRNRAFGRNAFDAALNEPIKHHVANAEHSKPGQFRGKKFNVTAMWMHFN